MMTYSHRIKAATNRDRAHGIPGETGRDDALTRRGPMGGREAGTAGMAMSRIRARTGGQRAARQRTGAGSETERRRKRTDSGRTRDLTRVRGTGGPPPAATRGGITRIETGKTAVPLGAIEAGSRGDRTTEAGTGEGIRVLSAITKGERFKIMTEGRFAIAIGDNSAIMTSGNSEIKTGDNTTKMIEDNIGIVKEVVITGGVSAMKIEEISMLGSPQVKGGHQVNGYAPGHPPVMFLMQTLSQTAATPKKTK